jgi:hypothetical protein
MYFLANGNDFISSLFNLNKRLFSLLVKVTASLDVLDQASRKKTDTDWVNLVLPSIST